MAWSIDVIRPAVEVIFEKAGMKCDVQFPEVVGYAKVHIGYEKEIPLESKRAILKLFADAGPDVHVSFTVMSIPDQGDLGGNPD